MNKMLTSDFGSIFEDDVESALKKGLNHPWTFRRDVIYKMGDKYVQFDFLLFLGRHIVNLECKSSTHSLVEWVNKEVVRSIQDDDTLVNYSERTLDQLRKQNSTLHSLYPGYDIRSYKLWKSKFYRAVWTSTKNTDVCEFLPHDMIWALLDSLNGSVNLYSRDWDICGTTTDVCGSSYEVSAKKYEITPAEYREILERSNADTHKTMNVSDEDILHYDYTTFGRDSIVKNTYYEGVAGQLGMFTPDVETKKSKRCR